jgi:ABC-type transport system substrate-binding protein
MIKGNKDLTLHSVDALNVGYLAFNTEKKPFDNVLVRQALNYATDKKAIVMRSYGSGTVAKSPIPPNMLGFKKDLKDYATIRKAKALLKQAGLEKGGSDAVVNAGAASVQPELASHCGDDPERLGESGREGQNCLLRVGRIPLRNA